MSVARTMIPSEMVGIGCRGAALISLGYVNLLLTALRAGGIFIAIQYINPTSVPMMEPSALSSVRSSEQCVLLYRCCTL